MRKASIVILVLFMAIAAFNARAGDSKSAMLLLLSTEPGNLTKSERLEIAGVLLQKIKALDAYIPSLTPNESQWLDAEWNSLASLPFEASNQKAFRLTSSPHYQTRELKEALKTICLFLEYVKKWAGVSVEREMFCWANATHNLTDRDRFNDSIRILVKNGKIKLPWPVREQLGLLPGDDAWMNFHMNGRLIQQRIVLPYMGNMMLK